jgi:hypothetical protein
MDFLANENFPLFSIKLLKNAGHNVASVIEETPGAKDLDILKRACRENLKGPERCRRICQDCGRWCTGDPGLCR